MKKYVFLFLFLFLGFFFASEAHALDYSIRSYKGDLELYSDNTASYTEVVTYHFDDSYKGQLISLGTAGKMPAGFAVDPNPTVSAITNGQGKTDIWPQVKDLGDGYELKLYNSGKAGDTVQVTVTWQLKNLLYVYKDIAELKWIPISDGEKSIQEVEFRIHGLKNVDKTALYVHTGYFDPPLTVKKTEGAYQVTVTNFPAKAQLELHAYWNRSALEQVDTSQASSIEYQAMLEEGEKRIAREIKFLRQLLNLYLPLLLVFVLLLSLLLFYLFKKSVQPSKHFPKDARLYEAPQDLAPLVLAANVYSLDMTEVNPATGVSGTLRFENMVQATLLDLVDRRKISISGKKKNPLVSLLSTDNLSDFEVYFLKMAMGDQTEVRVKKLFAHYQISESLYQGKNKANEKEIRRIGKEMTARFEDALKNLDSRVATEVHALNLPENYRSLTGKERSYLFWAQLLSGLLLVAAILIFLLALFMLSTSLFVYLFFAIFAAIQTGYYFVKAFVYRRDGVLNEEGAENYYLWSSFSHMLRDIAKLDKTEIEGVILWNRLLVYATLFGYADKVSQVMKLRKIQLENPAMNSYVYNSWGHEFYVSSSTFSNYGQVASTASHFSVSSSGSSGGGFSGGGGGGGIGAF